MGRILIIYPQRGLVDVLRGVLSGSHTLQVFDSPEPALPDLGKPQKYDAVLCGLHSFSQTAEIFSKAIESSAAIRLIPIAGTRAEVDGFSAFWNSEPARRQRKDDVAKEWLADPCTTRDILALFRKPTEPDTNTPGETTAVQVAAGASEGTEIDGYRLMGLIGTGGFGTTWLANNRTTGKLVAVKSVGGDDQLHQELAALRKYVHVADKDEHLIPVEHVNLIGSRLWIVTPLADSITGGYTAASYKPLTLAAYLETRGHIAEKAACRVATSLLQALVVIHQAGLMHGDVSPANVLSLRGRWVLADPGLVRFLGEPGICRDRAYYPQPAPSRASDDLYAVGLILWDMASGLWEMPSGRDRLRLDEQILRVISKKQTPMGRILCRALAQNPEQRFMIAEEMLRELRVAIDELPADPNPSDSLYHQLQSLRTGFAPTRPA